MKKTLATLLLLCLSLTGWAQRVQNLSLEGLGASGSVGMVYDTRFKGNDGFGFRIGVGYCFSQSEYTALVKANDCNLHAITFPLDVNYLLGKKKHKLEIGLGASMGYYHIQESTYPFGITYPDEPGNSFGYFMFAEVGYRYQPVQGLMLRVGLTPSWNFGDKYGLDRQWYYPYIGIGYSF